MVPEKRVKTCTYTVCHMVPEKRVKTCTYTVCHMVAEKHVKTCTYTVCHMVPEKRVKTCTYTVCHMVPEKRVKTCTYTVCHMVPEKRVKTCSYTVCHMVPEKHVKTCTYKVCHMVPEKRVKTCNYTVCHMVPEKRVKTCSYTVCHMVPEQHVKTCTYTVCHMVPEKRVKTCTYKVCHMVPEKRVKTCNYTVCHMVPEKRVKTCTYTGLPHGGREVRQASAVHDLQAGAHDEDHPGHALRAQAGRLHGDPLLPEGGLQASAGARSAAPPLAASRAVRPSRAAVAAADSEWDVSGLLLSDSGGRSGQHRRPDSIVDRAAVFVGVKEFDGPGHVPAGQGSRTTRRGGAKNLTRHAFSVFRTTRRAPRNRWPEEYARRSLRREVSLAACAPLLP